MKRFIHTLIFILAACSTSAQWRQQPYNMQYFGVKADSVLATKLMTPSNVLWYGAKGDSSQLNAQLFQKAVDSSRVVYVPEGKFLIQNTIYIPANTMIMGSGPGTNIITTGNFPAFTIVGDNITIQDLTVTGVGRGSTTSYVTLNPNNHGISIKGDTGVQNFVKNYIRVTRCVFDSMGGAGIYGQRNLVTPMGSKTPGYIASDNLFQRSMYGIFCDTLFEYNCFTNNAAHSNQYGAKISGGNNNIVGGNFSYNRTGLLLDTCDNNGHGAIVGAVINHNADYSVRTNRLTYGYLVSNCMMYYGKILINKSAKVKFVGCDIRSDSINVSGSSEFEMFDNKFIIKPEVNLSYGGIPSTANFHSNYYAEFEPVGLPGDLNVGSTGGFKIPGYTNVRIGGGQYGGLVELRDGSNAMIYRQYWGGADFYAGTATAQSINLMTNGTERLTLGASGNNGFGVTTPSARVDVNGSTGYNQLRLRTTYTPSSTADTNGNTGDFSWDTNYLYIKTSTGWKRSALSTF